MSRGARRKWYKKDCYERPMEPHNPGDGSLVEVAPDPDPTHPDALKITRIWPDDRVTTIRLTPPTEFSQKLILSVDNDIERAEPSPQQRENMNYFQETIGTKHYRPPYTVTSAVPGQKPGDDYHAGTGRRFRSRSEFTQYFKDNNLELIGPSDGKNLHLKTPDLGDANDVQIYDTTKGPTVPPQFAGARLYGKDDYPC